MKKISLKIFQVSLLISCVFNTSCSVILPLSLATSAFMATDVRTIGTQIDDKVIASKIRLELGKTDIKKLFANISVIVQEGRILLIGTVDDNYYAEEAEKIVWKIYGVKEVINELKIAEPGYKSNRAEDIWLAKQVMGKFVLEKHFSSGNFEVTVHDKVLYLLGIASNRKELEKAIAIAGSVNDIEKVVNHAIMKNDPRRIK